MVSSQLIVVCWAAFSCVIVGNEPPLMKYRFVQNTERWVGISRDNYTLIGKLDEHGEFHQVYKWETGFNSGPAYTLLNSGGLKPRRVYEFRSGVLVPGLMKVGGNFIPEVGGKIIRFSDYVYVPDAIPIWNLPGGFRPIKEDGK